MGTHRVSLTGVGMRKLSRNNKFELVPFSREELMFLHSKGFVDKRLSWGRW